MFKQLVRLMIAVALIVLGWSVGRAQTAAPDFELVLTRHETGADTVACKRGCTLGYIDAGAVKPAPQGAGLTCKTERRCEVALVGWYQR